MMIIIIIIAHILMTIAIMHIYNNKKYTYAVGVHLCNVLQCDENHCSAMYVSVHCIVYACIS